MTNRSALFNSCYTTTIINRFQYWTVGLEVKEYNSKTKQSTYTNIKQKTVQFKVLTMGRDIITTLSHPL